MRPESAFSRHPQQDLGDVHFLRVGGDAGLLRDEVVEFRLRDLDAVVDLALPQSAEDDVLPDVFAELVERQPVRFEALAQRRHGQPVGLGDATDGRIHRAVVDAHARFAGELHLGAVDDHALEHLSFQHLTRRRLDLLPAQLHLRDGRSRPQFVGRDHFVVDDGNDAVERPGRARTGRRLRRGCAGRTAELPAGCAGCTRGLCARASPLIATSAARIECATMRGSTAGMRGVTRSSRSVPAVAAAGSTSGSRGYYAAIAARHSFRHS